MEYEVFQISFVQFTNLKLQKSQVLLEQVC